MAGGVEAERLGCSRGSGADSLFRARVGTPRTADGARAVGQLACCVGRGPVSRRVLEAVHLVPGPDPVLEAAAGSRLFRRCRRNRVF